MIIKLEHNPEITEIPFRVIGNKPTLKINPETLDFGRSLCASEKTEINLMLRNPSLLPCKWEFATEGGNNANEDFPTNVLNLSKIGGILQPKKSGVVTVTFTPPKDEGIELEYDLKLQIVDTSHIAQEMNDFSFFSTRVPSRKERFPGSFSAERSISRK